VSGKTTVGKQGGLAGQGIRPVVFVAAAAPGIEVVFIGCAAFQVGNSPQVVAEDVVNRPASCPHLFCNRNSRVGISAQIVTVC
jgi:hypothetical protein